MMLLLDAIEHKPYVIRIGVKGSVLSDEGRLRSNQNIAGLSSSNDPPSHAAHCPTCGGDGDSGDGATIVSRRSSVTDTDIGIG